MSEQPKRVLVLAPNESARKMGLSEEIRVGWRQEDGPVWWFASCKNRRKASALILDAKNRYGQDGFCIDDSALRATTHA